MSPKGGFMGGETIFLLAVFGLAIFGVYKYITAESNDYAKLVEKIQSLEAQIQENSKDIDRQFDSVEAFEGILREYQERSVEIEKELEHSQDHMSRLRDSQIDLRDRSYPRQMEVKFQAPSGPIPIQIYTPEVKKKKRVTRKTVRKTKTGIESREETRISPLKGDPDAPLKKRVRKKATPVKKKKAVKKKTSSAKPPAIIKKVAKQIEALS